MEKHWEPVAESERYAVLDLLRGLALFGVLLVNLLNFFRVSLFTHMLEPHRNDLVSRLVEFKAFDVFSLTFGVGVAIQAARARRPIAFLSRRFLVLLAFGLVHMTLISNVDILCLYAVCGLALLPFLRLPAPALAIIGAAAVFLPVLLPVPAFPTPAELREHAAAATRIYQSAGIREQIVFRSHETVRLILPLLIGVAQKTFGLMLCGMAVWRSGVIRNPDRYRRMLWMIAVIAAAVGLALDIHIALAIGYGSALLAVNPSGWWTRPFAAAGRMAFTNYLTQSMAFALMFYGFGLFGRMAPAPAAALGIAFYVVQLCFSVWWLRTHRFGPFEWVWRSLSYGKRM